MQPDSKPFSPPRLQILLAEDILVPETQMMRMLRKLGHEVTRVHTGSQALALVLTGRFDLIFMDLHLPIMDTMTVAAAIRAREKTTDGHISLIAMSARTVAADRNRCLTVGIDLYISKPASIPELQIILQACCDPDSVQQTTRAPNWNRTVTLERAGGDEKSLNALVEVFVKDKPTLLADMNRALEGRKSRLLEQTALRLGEELSYVGALELSQTARQVARLGRNRDFSSAAKLACALQSQLSEMDAIMARSSL